MNVLIIDDSTLLRERLRAVLTPLAGVHITGEAASLVSAKRLLAKGDTHLVILDIRLSDGVSIDLIKSIKQSKPSPKVVVLTNYPYPQYRERCMKAGADYFLEKRNDFEKIPDLVFKIVKENNQ